MRYWLLIMLVGAAGKLASQVVYFWDESNGDVYAFDYLTCNQCVVFETSTGANSRDDLILLSNGKFLSTTSVVSSGITVLTLFDPSDGSVTVLPTNPALYYVITYAEFNGNFYFIGHDGLYVFDIISNTIQYIGGPWPLGIAGFKGEFVSSNNQLYYIKENGETWLIDAVDPSNSSLINTPPFPVEIPIGFTTLPSGVTIALTRGPGGALLWEYDVLTGTYTPSPCHDIEAYIPGMASVTIDGLTHLPPGVPAPPCLCLTEAGTVAADPITACVPGDVSLPHQGDEDLAATDVLNFILFTDPADTLGSVLIQQPGSTFVYDPNLLTPGITYYLAAVAGPDAGSGLVDLSGSSGCIDLSEAASVVWQPVPEVVFVAGTTELCPEACVTVTAQLITGTPPFNVAGQLLDNTGSVVGSFNETILTTSGDFTVCAPAGVQGLTVQATQVGDAACGCD